MSVSNIWINVIYIFLPLFKELTPVHLQISPPLYRLRHQSQYSIVYNLLFCVRKLWHITAMFRLVSISLLTSSCSFFSLRIEAKLSDLQINIIVICVVNYICAVWNRLFWWFSIVICYWKIFYKYTNCNIYKWIN